MPSSVAFPHLVYEERIPIARSDAAANGLLAARLSARGFTSDVDILETKQGFTDTQSTTANAAAGLEDRAQPWVVEALFKYHAACYLTHDSIEAAGQRAAQRLALLPAAVEVLLLEPARASWLG